MTEDEVTNEDVEAFQYSMLRAIVELSKRHTEINLSPLIIEGFRALNYRKELEKRKMLDSSNSESHQEE